MSLAAARSLAGPRLRFDGGRRGPRPRPPGSLAGLASPGAGWGPGRAGVAAVVLRSASAGGMTGSVRGLACRWGGGGGGTRAPTATRALGSGDAPGDGGGGGSIQDKLAARRAARVKRTSQAGGEGGRAAGGAARGGRLGGGGGRGGRGAGGGRGLSAAIALNRLLSRDNDPERLLRLVAEELNDVNLATAFSKLGKLCGSSSFPRNIVVDDCFRGLMVLARDMCEDGRLQAQAVANIVHAMSKLSAAGRLATDDAGVQDTLMALERRVVLVASGMEPQLVSNTAYGFALPGRMPGAEAQAALEAATVRVALDLDMKPQEVANVMWALATLGWETGAEARAALEAAVLRVGPLMNAQAAANTIWSFATLGLIPEAEA